MRTSTDYWGIVRHRPSPAVSSRRLLLGIALLAALTGSMSAHAQLMHYGKGGTRVEHRVPMPRRVVPAVEFARPPTTLDDSTLEGNPNMTPAKSLVVPPDAPLVVGLNAVDPDDYRDWPVWPNGVADGCTMTMIDAFHAVTAAHCFFVLGGGNIEELEDPDFVDYLLGGIEGMLGFNTITDFWLYPEWTASLNFAYDVALVRFDEPYGAASGWYGYGEASCGYLMTNDLESYSRPGYGPLDGAVAYWSGQIDWCPLWWQVRENRPTWEGESGSSISSGGAARIVRGILSTSHGGGITGDEGGDTADYVRWRDGFSDDFGAIIHGYRPEQADLVVTGFESDLGFGAFVLDPGEVPEGTFEPGHIWIHNYSDVSAFSGSITVSIRANSGLVEPTAADHLVWQTVQDVDIPPLGSVVVNPGSIALADLFTTGNSNVKMAAFVSAAADSDTGNNTTNPRTVAFLGSLVDLEPLNLAPMGGSYFQGQAVPVNIRIRNDGAIESNPIAVNFKLHRISGAGPNVVDLPSGQGPSLRAGENFVKDFLMPLAGVPAGEYRMEMIVVADQREGIVEVSNNSLKLASQDTWARIKVIVPEGTFTIPQDLRANYVATPAGGPYSTNQSVTTAFSVTNLGTQLQNWQGHFWAVNQSTGQVVHLAQGQGGNLASGALFASAANVPLTHLAPGTWRMVFQVRSASYDSVIGNNTKPAATTFQVVLGGLAGG